MLQRTVERPTISQIHPYGELAPFENLVSSPAHSATLLHGRSPFHCALSTFKHWERIASRRRPAFSSHLVLTTFRFLVYQALRCSGTRTLPEHAAPWTNAANFDVSA